VVRGAAVDIKCVKCGRELEVPKKLVGKQGKCPFCSELFFCGPGGGGRTGAAVSYRHPVKVMLLPLVTFGIYALVWYVTLRREMNPMGAGIPSPWLLIIPIVNLFWVWKFCEGVEIVSGKKLSGPAAFCLLFFLGVIGMAVIQDKLNKA
jgi:hypothetical protein